MKRYRFAAVSMAVLLQAAAASSSIRYGDVPSALHKYIPANAAEFSEYIARIDHETAERVREGQSEALVYYFLQSSVFTKVSRIEPALSAREYYASNREVPAAVLRRCADFLRALKGEMRDERGRYFQQHLMAWQRTPEYLREAYGRAMKFLYEKEIETREGTYETRGFSTDTSLAASYTVWNALSVVKAISPGRSVRRVLVVGPGVDFAPRTDFDDRRPPQSYQPYATADALLSLGLARRESLAIECADINDQVLAAIPASRIELRIEPGSSEFMDYQRRLRSHMDQALAIPVSASKLNIITARLTDVKYDLVIATNVLLYFPAPQLALALANMESMLATGGYLIHNDLRSETELYTKEMGLEWLQARRILIAQGRRAPLYDTFAILKK